MKTLITIIVLFQTAFSFSQSDNWIDGHAVWNYDWFSPGLGGSVRIETMNDTLIGGHLCQKLKRDLHVVYTINQNGDQAHDIVTSFSYIYFEQDTVWWYLSDNLFTVLYDFTATQGQTRMLHAGVENEECNDSSYLFIDSVYAGSLNGVNVTFYETRDSITNSIIHGGLVNSHFGMMSKDMDFSHLFFPSAAWCMNVPNDGVMYKLRCFEDDSVSYNPGNVDCEYYTYLSMNAHNDAAISVYPNPATESVVVSNFGQNASLVVRDITGKEVYSTDVSENAVIDIHSWESGTYLISIIGEKSSGRYALIKK